MRNLLPLCVLSLTAILSPHAIESYHQVCPILPCLLASYITSFDFSYLELALNGHLDVETRENLSQSHAASKSLLFTINDLLDLTRLESGHETSFNEPFDLPSVVREATLVYRNEAARRGLYFNVDISACPQTVIGDARKIRTVVANLTANARTSRRLLFASDVR